jgi:putative ABC transport system permease protein
MVLLETASVCALGAILGVSAGFLLSSGAEQWIRQYLAYEPAGRLLRPDAAVLATSILVTIALGLLAGIYPAFRASRVSPMEAVRHE